MPNSEQENIDSNDEIARQLRLAESLLPVLLRNLIISGLLDTNRLSEADYIWSVIEANPQFIDNLEIHRSIDDDFLVSAHDAIASKKLEVAVVLLATVVEHQLNMFYRQALDEHLIFDNDVITQIIRSNSLNDKTGWLFSLVSKGKMNDALRKSLLDLADLRNQIVHYKALPVKLDNKSVGSYNAIRKRVEKLDFSEVFENLEWLSDALNDALTYLRSNIDDYKLAQEAMQTLQRTRQKSK